MLVVGLYWCRSVVFVWWLCLLFVDGGWFWFVVCGLVGLGFSWLDWIYSCVAWVWSACFVVCLWFGLL